MTEIEFENQSERTLALERARSLRAAAQKAGAVACAAAAWLGAYSGGVGATAEMHGCLRQGYNYSGEIGTETVSAISATIMESREPQVLSGQVAGWVGVNNAAAEWLQAGIEQEAGQTTEGVYVESKIKGRPRQFTELGTIGIGQSIRVLIKEDLPRRPNHWTVYINGQQQPTDFFLPDSQQLVPQITAESWEGHAYTCNSFQFRFDHIKMTNKARQKFWKTPGPFYQLRDVRKDGFTAGDMS